MYIEVENLWKRAEKIAKTIAFFRKMCYNMSNDGLLYVLKIISAISALSEIENTPNPLFEQDQNAYEIAEKRFLKAGRRSVSYISKRVNLLQAFHCTRILKRAIPFISRQNINVQNKTGAVSV